MNKEAIEIIEATFKAIYPKDENARNFIEGKLITNQNHFHLYNEYYDDEGNKTFLSVIIDSGPKTQLEQ
jgi:4'-phosphopantetheinyl transferase EntD